jgi:redox-sensitive bicupin YhaK (pirin superfamily)
MQTNSLYYGTHHSIILNKYIMITIRKSEQRGYAEHGWLESFHTFSFAEYQDAEHMGYSVLRVINEDKIAAGMGFGLHPHRDMEIITYMLEGELRHQDSMGNGAVIRAGDVQYMCAGTGVRHSEFNASTSYSAHLLQIWILPSKINLPPSYEDKSVSLASKLNQWRLIASPDGGADTLKVHQNMQLFATVLQVGKSLNYTLQENRCYYLQVARGSVTLNGLALSAGDAAQVNDEQLLAMTAILESEVLLFDLPISI